MKIQAGIIVVLLTIGCRKPIINVVERTCYTSNQAAKTAAEARQKLVGTWRLVAVVGGFRQPGTNPAPIANITLTFQANGQLITTTDGVRQPPIAYDVIYGPLPYDQATSGSQLVPSSRQEFAGFSLDRNTIYVCDGQLRLDYGTVVDGYAQEFDRVN